MAKEITEGLLLDIITKRRAGQFTAEELGWAADHPEIVRWAKDHLEAVEGLRTNRLRIRRSELFPSECYASELIPKYENNGKGVRDMWEVVEDVEPSRLTIADLETVSFFNEGDKDVSGETARKQAVKFGANLGLVDAKYLLDNQAEIPVRFRDRDLVFTGTLLRNVVGGKLNVPYLWWDGDSWCLDFHKVDHDDWWSDPCRLLFIIKKK